MRINLKKINLIDTYLYQVNWLKEIYSEDWLQ